MNFKKIKLYIFGLVQAPLIIFLCIAGYVDLFLRRCLLKLGYVGPQPKPGYLRHEDTAQEPNNKPSPPGKQELLAALMGYCRSHDNDWIDQLRSKIEVIPFSQRAAGCSPDRHLYAVLKPTREESLKRIKIVFAQLDTKDLLHVEKGIKELGNF